MKRLFPLFVVMFLGYLGFSLAIPLFPPLFFDHTSPFLPATASRTARRILLGILFSMYPLGQLIGAPILGKLSDRHGRKSILLITLFGTVPGYIGSALAVKCTIPPLLFVSRMWVGLLEGNVTIPPAVISDISTDAEEKTKYFGRIVSVVSSAFLIGPYLGGKLSDTKHFPFFGYDTPFLCAAILSFIGSFIVLFFFKETCQGDRTLTIRPLRLFITLFETLRLAHLKKLFAINICFSFGIFFFLNFFSTYLVNQFGFNAEQLGKINAYVSIFTILFPFLFKTMERVMQQKTIALAGLILMACSLILFIIPSSPYALFLTLIPIGLSVAITFSYPALIISNACNKRIQGQVLGTNTAIQMLGEGATALTGGLLMALSIDLPFIIGASIALLGAGLLHSLRKEASGRG